MDLFTKEHKLIKTEYELADSLKFEEEKEREMLSLFSENIRKSHQVRMKISLPVHIYKLNYFLD